MSSKSLTSCGRVTAVQRSRGRTGLWARVGATALLTIVLAACGRPEIDRAPDHLKTREANERLVRALAADPVDWLAVRDAVRSGATEVPEAVIGRVVASFHASHRRNQASDALQGLGDQRLAMAFLESARTPGRSEIGRHFAAQVSARLHVDPPDRIVAELRRLAAEGLIPIATLRQALEELRQE